MEIRDIQAHKATIKWFCDNPSYGVWVRDKNDIIPGCLGNWELVYEPGFWFDDLYVINDIHADIRKAFVDGITIEFYNAKYDSSKAYGQWHKLDKLQTLMCFNAADLRIKPVPTFKVGDWVVSGEYGIIQLTTINVDGYNHQDAQNPKSCTYTKLWKPTKGEWCIFHDDTSDSYIIRKYACKRSTNESPLKYVDSRGVYWKYVYPLKMVHTLKDC